jgi:hypothetical protein
MCIVRLRIRLYISTLSIYNAYYSILPFTTFYNHETNEYSKTLVHYIWITLSQSLIVQNIDSHEKFLLETRGVYKYHQNRGVGTNMSETEKICKLCKVLKPISAFYTGAATCSVCANAKRRIARQKSTPADSMYSRLYLYHAAIGEHIKNNDGAESILGILDEMIKECRLIMSDESAICIPWTMHPTIETFFKIALAHGLTKHEMMSKLHDESLKDAFSDVFGVDQDEAMRLTPELDNFYTISIGLNIAYNFFIEKMNANNEKISNTASKIPFIKFEYNFITKEITLYNNPLKLTRKSFLEKIKSDTLEHYGLMYYHVNNCFEPFYKLESL